MWIFTLPTEVGKCSQYIPKTKKLSLYNNMHVTQSCLTLCDPINYSMPGFPVHHQLSELTNSCPLSRWCHIIISFSVIPFSSRLAFNLSQHQGLIKWVSSSHQVAKVLGVSASTSVLPVNIQYWFPLGWTGWISLQSKGLSSLQHRSSKASVVQCSDFFVVQFSHPYMTTGKTIALTR